MRKYITLFGISAAIAVMFTDCKKTTSPVNADVATITFIKAGPKFLTDNITVNAKDSIQFQYTVSSPVPVITIGLAKAQLTDNASVEVDAVPKDSVKALTTNMRNFTITHKIVADSIPGIYNYNVIARDINGYYIGSSKVITVTVAPNFYYYTNAQMFVPDTIAKTNPCYYSSSANASFSYTSAGAANSPKIDFGFFFNTDSTYSKGVKTSVIGPSIYALNVMPVPSQISIYDISTWTKNATLMKLGTTPTWAQLISGGAIKQGVITNLKSGAVNKLPVFTASTATGNARTDNYTQLAVGNVIFFKTADGRYGALNILYINQTGAAKTTFINFDVKMAY